MTTAEVAERRWHELRAYPNVLSVGLSKKFIGGSATDADCITVFVSKKVALSDLKEGERIPQTVEGVPVDVVVFDPDWTMGETSASRKSPAVQKRIAGGVRR